MSSLLEYCGGKCADVIMDMQCFQKGLVGGLCVANIVCSGAQVTKCKWQRQAGRPSFLKHGHTLATSKSRCVEEFWFSCIRKLKRKKKMKHGDEKT